MQIGADIYCDTNIILPALERLQPEPSLYPGAAGARAGAVVQFRAHGLARDGRRDGARLRRPASGLLEGPSKEDYLYVDISKAAMEPKLEANVQLVRAQLAWLEEALADGRPFVLGDRPSALDLGYFHPISLVRKNGPPPEVDALLGLAPIVAVVRACRRARPRHADEDERRCRAGRRQGGDARVAVAHRAPAAPGLSRAWPSA